MARRNRNPDILFAGLLTQAKTARPRFEVDPVRRAYEFSKSAHGYQLRRSGDPYITHCVEVGLILFELLEGRADEAMIAAALLHDVVEDTRTTVDEVEARFGADVALLVDGLTKISTLERADRLHEQAHTLRKMLLSMARDLRVVIIKLADRLHNMRTLTYLPRERGTAIAAETLDIYAPLAHRLGIAAVKWELEDLSFKYLEEETYRELSQKMLLRRAEREEYLEEVRAAIERQLTGAALDVTVLARPKHFYSIAKKMRDQGLQFEEIYDLLGVRVLVGTKGDCYQALGLVHELYPPMIHRIKDYIANAKANGYQSIHTTVLGPHRRLVEVQIRTHEMHTVAELGVAAHYAYKEGEGLTPEAASRWADLMRQTQRLTEDVSAGTPQEFMEDLKLGLHQDEVFVFTPKGDAIRLPKGATPLDFAYHIHSQVGARTVGAKVDGRIVPLKTELANGDRVEIITSPSARPNPDWLQIVKSSRARSKIRRFLKSARHTQSAQLGREILERELKRARKRLPGDDELADAAEGLGFDDPTNLLAALANGQVSVQRLRNRLYPEDPPVAKVRRFSLEGLKDIARPARGVSIQGLDNLMIRFAKCCMPVPGDQITGVITRGRGVTVHRVDCPNTFEGHVERERLLPVEWDTQKDQAFVVKLQVFGLERRGLLADVAKAVAQTDTNIRNVDMGAQAEKAFGVFFVEVTNLSHLKRVIKAMRSVKGVTDVMRFQEYGTDGEAPTDLAEGASGGG